MKRKRRGLQFFICWQRRWANPLSFKKKMHFFNFPIFALTSFFWLNGSHNTSVRMLGLSWRVNVEDWKFSFFGENDELTPSHFFQKRRFSNLSKKCLSFPFFWANGSHNKSVGMLGLSWRVNEEDWKFSFFGKNDEPYLRKRGGFRIFQSLP